MEWGRLDTEGTDRHTDKGTQWGMLRHCQKYIQRRRQPVKQGPTGALSTVHTEGHWKPTGERLDSKGTDNQTDRGNRYNQTDSTSIA